MALKPKKQTQFFVKAAFIVFAVFCVITIFNMQHKNNGKIHDIETLIAQIKETQARVDELQDQVETPYDKEYIIKVAKEKLNYSLPNEIIFYNDLAN